MLTLCFQTLLSSGSRLSKTAATLLRKHGSAGASQRRNDGFGACQKYEPFSVATDSRLRCCLLTCVRQDILDDILSAVLVIVV